MTPLLRKTPLAWVERALMRAHKLQAVGDSQDLGKFLRVVGVPLVLNSPATTTPMWGILESGDLCCVAPVKRGAVKAKGGQRCSNSSILCLNTRMRP